MPKRRLTRFIARLSCLFGLVLPNTVRYSDYRDAKKCLVKIQYSRKYDGSDNERNNIVFDRCRCGFLPLAIAPINQRYFE